MNAPEEQIQAIDVENAHTSRIEAEAEILQAIDSTSSQMEPLEGTENLYHIRIRAKEGEITATLYITDNPETDLTGLKEEFESLVDKRKDILDDSSEPDDLMRAIAIQSRMLDVKKRIELKKELLEIPNPVLNEKNSKITASLI